MKNLSAAAQLLTGAAKPLQPGAEIRAGHRARSLLFSAASTGRWYLPCLPQRLRKELDASIPSLALRYVRETREQETRTPVEVYEELKGRSTQLRKIHDILLQQDRNATYRVYSSSATNSDEAYAEALKDAIRELKKINPLSPKFYAHVYNTLAEDDPYATPQKLCADARRVVRCIAYYLRRTIESRCGGIAYAAVEMAASRGNSLAYPLAKEDDIHLDHKAAIRAGFLGQYIIGGLEIPYCRILNLTAVMQAAGRKWIYGDFLPSGADGRSVNIQVRTLDEGRKSRQSFVIERDYAHGLMLPPTERGRTLQVMLSEFAKAVGAAAAADMRRFVAWVALDKDTLATGRLKERDLERIAEMAGDSFERVTRDQTLYLDVADTLAGIREEARQSENPDPPTRGPKSDKGDFVLHSVQSSSCKIPQDGKEESTLDGTQVGPSLDGTPTEPETPPLSRIRRKVPAPDGAEILDADPESV